MTERIPQRGARHAATRGSDGEDGRLRAKARYPADMTAWGRTLVAIVGASVGVTGCLYFTDLNGLAGQDPADAATGDGGGLDGTLPTDGAATTDADAGSDAGGPRPCEAGTHDFCVDFDDGMLNVPPWTAISRDGTLEVEDGPSVSSPKALHAMLPARDDLGTVLRNRAVKSWAVPWRAVHAELDVFVKTPAWRDTDIDMELVELSLTSDTSNAGAGLFVRKNGIFAVASKAGEPPVVGAAFPYDTWTHITFDLDASHFRITVGSQILGSGPMPP